MKHNNQEYNQPKKCHACDTALYLANNVFIINVDGPNRGNLPLVRLFPKEQKRCHHRTRERNYLLYVRLRRSKADYLLSENVTK